MENRGTTTGEGRRGELIWQTVSADRHCTAGSSPKQKWTQTNCRQYSEQGLHRGHRSLHAQN